MTARIPGLPVIVTYDDPAVRFDPAAPYELEFTPDIDDRFVLQVLPVPDSMRPLAAPLTLPERMTVTFYRDGDQDERTRPTLFAVDLDPDANHGYRRASFGPHYDEGRGFSITVKTDPASPFDSATLGICPKCRDPWLRATQEQYGNAWNCGACKYHDFYDIGD